MIRYLVSFFFILVLASCQSTQTKPEQDTGKNKQKLASIQIELAAGYYSKGQLKIAYDTIYKAISNDPASGIAQSLAGIVLLDIGRVDVSEEHHLKAVGLEPKSGIILNNYASYLCQTGRPEESVDFFLSAVQDPFYKTPHAALANAASCMIAIKKYQDAELYLRKSLKFNANYGPTLYALADLLHKQHKNFNARAFMQRFEAVNQHSAQSLMLGYRIESALDDSEATKKYKNLLAKHFPQSEQFRLIK